MSYRDVLRERPHPDPITNPPATHATLSIETQKSSHFGPLPHPQILEQYGRIVKNGSERIFEMAEREQTHRFHMDRWTMLSINFGQISALLLGLSSLFGGIFLVYNNKNAAGFAVIIAGAATLAGVYFVNRRSPSAAPPEESPNKDQPKKT
jgi:uncharacterized membrane protein